MSMKRGDIYYANLGPDIGSVQGGSRPVVIIQNDVGNAKSTTVIVAALTSSGKHYGQCTHCYLERSKYPALNKDSTVLLEQIRTISKSQLKYYIGKLLPVDLDRVNIALKKSLDLR